MTVKEPRILLTGRQQSTLDILAEELARYGRDVTATNNRRDMEHGLIHHHFDFVVIGGGLDDEKREEVAAFVKGMAPSLPVHLVPRTPEASPAAVIPFVNHLAVLFKVHAAENLAT